MAASPTSARSPTKDGQAYQVGLEFHDMRPEARGCVEALLNTLEPSLPEAEAGEAPEDDATST